MKLLFAMILSLAFLSGCHSALRKDHAFNEVTFAEFKKVLSPRSQIFPMEGGLESILLMSMPEDPYAKVYSMNHKTKKFSVLFDAGQNIGSISRDHLQKNFYLMIDKHGDENYQIYKFDPVSRKSTKLYGNEGFKASIIDYSQDGQHIYISSNHENKALYRVYDLNPETGEVTVLSDKVNFRDGVANESNTQLALSNRKGNNDAEIYLLDTKTKKQKKLLSKKATRFDPSFFDHEGKFLFINSDDERDRMGCAKISVSGNPKLTWVKTDKSKDIRCHYNRNTDVTTVVSLFNGQISIDLYKGVFGEPIGVKFPERSLVSQFTTIPNSTTGIVRIMSSDSPGDYYAFDMAKGANAELLKISQLNQSSIQQFAQSFDFFNKSFDGLEIHSIIYAKEEWTKSKVKRPVILWPHGGPDNQEMHVFHPFFQYWVQKGFVVLAPNFRGSTGYGKKFETLNDRDWGGGHIKDLISAKKAIQALDYVDANNIFIVGGSFGGFSTLSAISQYPDEFKGAVAMVALANLFTFMKSIPPDPGWQGEFLTEVGDPVKDKKLYEERSPFFHASKVKTPLKIYQAENDTRTVKAEMDAYVEELKKHGIPVEYEVLLNEGHGIARTESWEKVLQGTVDFLRRQMK